MHRLTSDYENPYRIDWRPYRYQDWRTPVDTAVDLSVLKKLATQLETLPPGFVLQAQVAKIMEDRRKMTAGRVAVKLGLCRNHGLRYFIAREL